MRYCGRNLRLTIEQLTKSPTETDLEVQLNRAIRLAFPWLPENSLRHQLKFRVQIGRKSVEVDGTKGSYEAKADAIVYRNNDPLAVLELKRTDQKLSANDELQGLSYAKLHNPSPPLVVVTNGTDVKIIETYTGKPWKPESETEAALQAYLQSASKVAKADLKAAVEALMGNAPSVWMPAIRFETEARIESLSGTWDDTRLPFVKGWVLPRRATSIILEGALSGRKMSLLVGPPLSGKSNVLKEICEQTQDHPSLAALYLEAGCGGGVYQSLADVLSRALDWPVTPMEAREWLVQVSKSTEHKLLILVDDIDPQDLEARRSLEDLLSHTFGPGLALALTAHESAAERLCKSKNLLGSSPIGRVAEWVDLGPLTDEEFIAAALMLQERKVLITKGAEASGEFREPWVLRAVVGNILETLESAPDDTCGSVPPQLSLDLIQTARRRFTTQEVLRLYQAMAMAILDDAKDPAKDSPLLLESLDNFVVRRSTLKRHLESEEINESIAVGFLRAAMHSSETPILYVRLPDLVASELARVVARELSALAERHEEAVSFLVNVATLLPVGDIIAAQAVVDVMARTGQLPYDIFSGLLDLHPRKTPLEPGVKIALNHPSLGYVTMEFKHGGVVEIVKDGRVHTQVIEEGEFGVFQDAIYPWLILSHLASQPIVGVNEDGDVEHLTPEILLTIGAANMPLRKPGRTEASRRAAVHDMPDGSMICHAAGFQEQVTHSIFEYLSTVGDGANDWIEKALKDGSKFLLCRIHIALTAASKLANQKVAAWAKATLEDKIGPALIEDLRKVCGEVSS